jgi:hypothetical protein
MAGDRAVYGTEQGGSSSYSSPLYSGSTWFESRPERSLPFLVRRGSSQSLQ